MIFEIIAGFIGLVGTIFIAYLAYRQAKKVAFFGAYFQRKADSYEELLSRTKTFPRTKVELEDVCDYARKSMLYCNASTLQCIENMVDCMVDICDKIKKLEKDESVVAAEASEFIRLRAEVDSALRKEMQDCQKFKFD